MKANHFTYLPRLLMTLLICGSLIPSVPADAKYYVEYEEYEHHYTEPMGGKMLVIGSAMAISCGLGAAAYACCRGKGSKGNTGYGRSGADGINVHT